MPALDARRVALISAIALGARFAAATALGVVGEPERWEYDVIAANIANGEGHVYDRLGFAYRAYAPPAWSFILAALHALPLGRVGVQILQALLCAGGAVVFAEVAERIFGSAKIATLIGIAVALQPSVLYYSVVKSDPLPLNLVLLGSIALIGISVLETPTLANAIRFGLVTGVAGLARGTPLVAVPLLGLFLFARKDRGGRPAFGISALACALTLIPWLTRNALVLGQPTIASTSSENFWRGNHQGASGSIRNLDGADITRLSADNEALPQSVRNAIVGGSEMELSAAFAGEARAFLMQRPHEATLLFLRKLRYFWLWAPSDARDYDPRLIVGYNVFYLLELALAMFGMSIVFRGPQTARGEEKEDASDGRRHAFWCLSLAAAISVLQSAFYVQGRHRFLVEPILLVFAAVPLARAMDGMQARWAAYVALRTPRSGRSLTLEAAPRRQDVRPRKQKRGPQSGARDPRKRL